MTRGRLYELVSLMFADNPLLSVGQQSVGNSLVQIRSGRAVHIDGIPLDVTGPNDERDVPDHLAHRVVAILRTARGATPDLPGEWLEVMKHAGVGKANRATGPAEVDDS